MHLNNMGIGTSLKLPASGRKGFRLSIVGKGHRIEIEDGARIEGLTVHVAGNGNTLKIRQDCSFAAGAHIWLLWSDNTVEIGERTRFVGGGCIWTADNHTTISIGTDCMIAGGIDIRCGDGHPIFDLATGAKINHASHIRVGNKVWLAKDVRILKNVTIGNGSIIGAYSVVTRDCPETSIMAGCPAKVVKQGIRWEP